MRAKYATTCPRCHKPIKAGEAIVRSGQSYVHRLCPRNWVDQIAGLDDGTELGKVVAAWAAVALLAHESAAERITLHMDEANRILAGATQCLKGFSDDHAFNAAEESLRSSMDKIKSRILEQRAEAVRERDAARESTT
jgi:hypothetical protein